MSNFEDAWRLISESDRVRLSEMALELQVGWKKAQEWLDKFQRDGVIGPVDAEGYRRVLDKSDRYRFKNNRKHMSRQRIYSNQTVKKY